MTDHCLNGTLGESQTDLKVIHKSVKPFLNETVKK